jgi:hypothetical protein
MFNSLSSVLRNQAMIVPSAYLPHQPKRKSLARPLDNGTFVLPLKQSFIKDARIMPGTTRMLALLAGWVGKGDKPILETTKGIIGKHLGREVRQIYRYLKDAMEEGYLLYTCTKNRMGYITGIKIWLNTLAIRKSTNTTKSKNGEKQARTQVSDTNEKLILNKGKDSDLWKRLERLAQTAGFEMPPDGTT